MVVEVHKSNEKFVLEENVMRHDIKIGLYLLIITFLLSLITGAFVVNYSSVSNNKVNNAKEHITIYPDTFKGASGYTVNDNEFTVISDDPQLKFSLNDNKINSIAIDLQEKLNSNLPIQIYYASKGEVLTEEKSVTYDAKKGEQEIVIKIPEGVYSTLRIDAGTVDSSSFKILNIYGSQQSQYSGSYKLYLSLMFYVIYSMLFFFLWKRTKVIEQLGEENLIIVLIMLAGSLILFKGIIFGNYKLSYTNLNYSMPPFNNMGIHTAGPLLSDVADSFLVKMYDIFNQFNFAKLWGSKSAFGSPYAGFNELLFPLNYLFFLGLEKGQLFVYIMKYSIGFYGMYLFLRNIKYKTISALVGGTVFAFSSVMVVWGGWPHTDVTMLAPFLFLMVDKYIMSFSEDISSGKRKESRILYLLIFTIVLYLMLVAGMPTYVAYFLYFGFAYLLFRLVSMYKRDYKLIGFCIASISISILLSGIMSFAYTGSLFFSTGNYQVERAGQAFYSLDISYLRTLLYPYLRTDLSMHINESTLFSGLIFLFVIPFIFIRRKERQAELKFWILSTVILLILIFTQISGNIFKFFPLINTSSKIRVIILFNFICSVISAMVIEFVSSHRTIYKKMIKLIIIIGFLAIPSIITAYTVIDFGVKYIIQNNNIFYYVIPLWTIAIILILMLTTRRNIWSIALYAIIVINMTMFANAYMPLIDKNADIIPVATDSVQYLKKNMNNTERMAALGDWTLFPNTNVYYGLNDISAHDFVNTNSDMKNFLTAISKDSYHSATWTSFPVIENKNLLSYASVKYILAPPIATNYIKKIDSSISKNKTTRKAVAINGVEGTLEQSFVSEENDLSSINILLSTYRRGLSKNDSLKMKIMSAKDSKILFEQKVNLSSIQDNSIYNFKFNKPIQNSKGQEYIYILEPTSKFEFPLAVWITKDDLYDGSLSINGVKQPGDLALEVDYGSNDITTIKFDSGESIEELNEFSPRAFIANNLIITGSNEEILNKMKNKYLQNTVFLTQDEYDSISIKKKSLDIANDKSSDILSFTDYGNNVEIKAKTQANSFLVLNDYYDKDWKAYVDGVEVPILKANYLFRAIYLPKDGEHDVRFVYVPTQLYVCIGVSIAGFIVLLCLIFYRKRIDEFIEKIYKRNKRQVD